MPHPSAWQDVLDPPFVQRLLRPWLHPGRIDPGMANAIVARYQPMTPLPLVEQLTARQQHRAATQPAFSQPIVYAQPAPVPAITPISPAQRSMGSTVIQAKFMASRGTTALPLTASTALPDPVQSSVERSPDSVADPLPLPLLQPPSPLITDRPPLRPRRPRFERDMGRHFIDPHANLDAHLLEEPAAPVLPTATTTATTPLPLALTATPNPPNLTETQATPLVVFIQSALAQQQQTDQRLPLVPIRVGHPRERGDRPLRSEVRPEGGAVRPLAATTVASQQATPRPAIPRVQTMSSSDRSALQPRASTAQPLVFSAPAVRAVRGASANGARASSANLSQIGMSERAFMATEVGRSMGAFAASTSSIPVVSAQPQTVQAKPPSVDIDALADRVERKLMRRLVVERERRGKGI